MIRKTHISIALAGLALLAGMQAQACTTGNWGVGLTGGAGGAQSAIGGVVAGQPNGGGGGTAARYSGSCGLRAAAVNQYVQDGSPSAEGTYIARFYAHVNFAAGSTPVIFQVLEGAPDGVNSSILSIQYDRDDQQFEAVNSAGTSFPIGALNNAPNDRFYHVHLNWSDSGNLTVSIQGNQSTALDSVIPNAEETFVGNFTAPTTGPDFVRLGWVNGGGTGAVQVDAFESRRTTDIPRLCRGDVNGNGTINVGDRISVTNEIIGTSLAVGQPDCNENGLINVGDRICVTNAIVALRTCTP